MNANELAFHSLIVRLNGAGFCEAATMLRQQHAEIESLKKQLEASALLNYNKGHEDGRNIALPIKTLADEEIVLIGQDIDWSEFEYSWDAGVEFARAILRKAQEK